MSWNSFKSHDFGEGTLSVSNERARTMVVQWPNSDNPLIPIITFIQLLLCNICIAELREQNQFGIFCCSQRTHTLTMEVHMRPLLYLLLCMNCAVQGDKRYVFYSRYKYYFVVISIIIISGRIILIIIMKQKVYVPF